MKRINFFIYLILSMNMFPGCQQETKQSMPDTGIDTTQTEVTDKNFTKAICVLHPAEGKNIKGIVTFTKENNGIKVVVDIENLTPGNHGFHIHQFGDCSASDASSAGDHFNPKNVKHGARTDSVRHAGDFGNLEAGEDGKAHLEFTDNHISFSGENSIIGKAVIIHEKADDLKSQPSGDAGGRVACGVIGISE